MAESLAAGAVGRQVALRHRVHPDQLYAWRRELTAGDAGGREPGFVPVAMLSRPGVGADGTAGGIEIAVGSMVVRIAPGADLELLRGVLSVVMTA
ncbi:MAG: transposase [Dongiaceae bacterium]